MDDLFGEADAAPVADPIRTWFGAHHERIKAAPDHFAVLGIRWDEPPETMRRAYFSIARDLHPDKFNDAPDDIQKIATELFDKARSAWEVLGDDTKREAYIARVIRGEKTEDEKATERVQAILEGEGYFKRGITELNSGRISPANDCFVKACELVPEETEFAAYLGYTRFRMHQGKNEAEANAGVETIRAALKEKENLDNVWVLLGMIQRLKGDDAAARRSFIKALQIKPANPDAAREMKRLEQTRQQAAEEPKAGGGGFFSRLFGKK
jgi:curved DNA-binding protein CbpA